MFLQTYGDLYQQNSLMFQVLFRDLRAYYNGAAVNLVDVLDYFFSTLLQRMFTLMNHQFIYTESFFACTSENMEQLQPFGGIPYKLKSEIKRSFTAARTFSQGLMIGREVIQALSKVRSLVNVMLIICVRIYLNTYYLEINKYVRTYT